MASVPEGPRKSETVSSYEEFSEQQRSVSANRGYVSVDPSHPKHHYKVKRTEWW